MARSAECRCDSHFTCGYCLRNAPPYFFTTSSGVRIYETQTFPIKYDEKTNENSHMTVTCDTCHRPSLESNCNNLQCPACGGNVR